MLAAGVGGRVVVYERHGVVFGLRLDVRHGQLAARVALVEHRVKACTAAWAHIVLLRPRIDALEAEPVRARVEARGSLGCVEAYGTGNRLRDCGHRGVWLRPVQLPQRRRR